MLRQTGTVEVREIREGGVWRYDVWDGETHLGTHNALSFVGRGGGRSARAAALAAADEAVQRSNQRDVPVQYGDTFVRSHFPNARVDPGKAANAAARERWAQRLKEPIDPTVPTHAADGRQRDELSRRQFNGRFTVKTTSPANAVRAAELAKEYFGHAATVEDVARLSGAPDGADVEVHVTSDGNLQLRVSHPMYDRCVRTMRMTPDGPVIHNAVLFIHKDAPRGFGTRILAAQVRAARELGVKLLDLTAGGSPTDADTPERMNGYYTWPKLGYEGKLSTAHITAARAAGIPLPDKATTTDLFNHAEGPGWWKANGSQLKMVFDLADDSTCMERLNDYLDENGIVP